MTKEPTSLRGLRRLIDTHLIRRGLGKLNITHVKASQADVITPPSSNEDPVNRTQTPNEAIQAKKVLRTAQLTAVGNWITDRCSKRLEQLQGEVVSEIRKTRPVGDDARHRLEVLQRDVDKRVTNAYGDMKHDVESQLAALAKILDEKNRDELKGHHGVIAPKGDHGLILDTSVLGATVEDHFAKMAGDAIFKINASLRQGYEADDGVEELVNRVTGTNQIRAEDVEVQDIIRAAIAPAAARASLQIQISMLQSIENSINKVIQAAVTAFASEADDASMEGAETKKNMGWQWTSVGDGRVCEYCEAMDGGIYTMDDEPVGESPEIETTMPAHYGCRCSKVPVDLDAEPAPDMKKKDFRDYLNEFSREEKEAAFGKEAYAAYQRGELTPSQLIQNNENLMSLEEFRAQ